MKLLVVIPDGVGIRNFVLGRFLQVASAEPTYMISVASGLPLSVIGDSLPASVEAFEMPIYKETLPTRLMRKTSEVAHLKNHRTAAMQDNLLRLKPHGFSKGELVARGAYALAAVPGGASAARVAHRHLAERDSAVSFYVDRLRAETPDVVFATHQRPLQSLPLMVAARRLGIPTASFIFSWDNLTSKGRIPFDYDHYLVWSELMKSELLATYPAVPEKSIHVVGTPQFEPYGYDQFGWTSERFADEIRSEPARRRICFTGGDVTTSPNDPAYVAILAEANRQGEFGRSTDVILRPSPAESPDRYRSVLDEFPEIIVTLPRWIQSRPEHPEPWSQRVPIPDDVDLLKSLTLHCDVNVNVASTMTLDFAFADKPVINPASDGTGFGRSRLFNDAVYYSYEHYQKVVETEAVEVVRTSDMLIAAVREALLNPSNCEEGRKRLLRLQVRGPLRGTSERFLNALETMLDSRAKAVPPSLVGD